MSVILRVHDYSVDPQPTLPPANGGSSLVASATLTGLQLPGPGSQHAAGFRVLAVPGLTRTGQRRSLVRKHFDLVWPILPMDQLIDLTAVFRAAKGMGSRFILSLDAKDAPPVSWFAGAVIGGAAPGGQQVIAPTANYGPHDVIELYHGERVNFRRAWFTAPLEQRQLSVRQLGGMASYAAGYMNGQMSFWAVALRIMVELPTWEA